MKLDTLDTAVKYPVSELFKFDMSLSSRIEKEFK